MCTVTFIPQKNGYCLTSSRDEDVARVCFPPRQYQLGDETLIYPKDQLANGSWIAATATGRAACLLNGAYLMDAPASHPRSRGIILLESFRHSNILEFSKSIDLFEVGPFTLLLLDYTKYSDPTLLELRWDGERKYISSLDTKKPHIWSSVTLYDKPAAEKRKEWFSNWLKQKENATTEGIFNFHNQRHGNDPTIDILMQRLSYFRTVSISQIQWNKGHKFFKYLDLTAQKEFLTSLELPEKATGFR